MDIDFSQMRVQVDQAVEKGLCPVHWRMDGRQLLKIAVLADYDDPVIFNQNDVLVYGIPVVAAEGVDVELVTK